MSAIHDRLFQVLKVHCPGAVEGVMRLELLNTVEEACRQGQIWGEDVPFQLTAGVEYIDITPPGTDIVELMGLKHREIDLNSAVFEGGRLLLPTEFTTLQTLDAPLIAQFILCPAIGQCDLAAPEEWIPEDLWATHYAMFIDGAVSKLCSQASKPYTNAAKTALHGRKFRNAVSVAYNNRKRRKVFGIQGWNFPRF